MANLPCDPSMILGMIWIKSSELSRLAAVTAVVAASTTDVIWALVRELERVLLVLLDETRDCLELLVEDRLALSSMITEEAREAVVDPVPDESVSVVSVSDSVEEESLPEPPPSSLLVHEIMVRLKRSTNKMCKILFIFSPISNERRRFEELLFQNPTIRLSIQFDILIVKIWKCNSSNLLLSLLIE